MIIKIFPIYSLITVDYIESPLFVSMCIAFLITYAGGFVRAYIVVYIMRFNVLIIENTSHITIHKIIVV